VYQETTILTNHACLELPLERFDALGCLTNDPVKTPGIGGLLTWLLGEVTEVPPEGSSVTHLGPSPAFHLTHLGPSPTFQEYEFGLGTAL